MVILVVVVFIAARAVRRRVIKRQLRKRVQVNGLKASNRASVIGHPPVAVDPKNDGSPPDSLATSIVSDHGLEPHPPLHLAEPSEDSVHPTVPEYDHPPEESGTYVRDKPPAYDDIILRVQNP